MALLSIPSEPPRRSCLHPFLNFPWLLSRLPIIWKTRLHTHCPQPFCHLPPLPANRMPLAASAHHYHLPGSPTFIPTTYSELPVLSLLPDPRASPLPNALPWPPSLDSCFLLPLLAAPPNLLHPLLLLTPICEHSLGTCGLDSLVVPLHSRPPG